MSGRHTDADGRPRRKVSVIDVVKRRAISNYSSLHIDSAEGNIDGFMSYAQASITTLKHQHNIAVAAGKKTAKWPCLTVTFPTEGWRWAWDEMMRRRPAVFSRKLALPALALIQPEWAPPQLFDPDYSPSAHLSYTRVVGGANDNVSASRWGAKEDPFDYFL